MLIPLDQIALVERRRRDPGDINGLAASIREHGQITPGVVRPATEEDRDRGVDPEATPYVLVAGGRRYAACAIAGIEEYDAKLLGELPLLTQKVLELEENLNRKDLNWDEEVLLKDEINQLRLQEAREANKAWTQGDLAKELQETQANTSRDLKLAAAIKANPALRKAGTKAAAVRQLAYDKKIEERTASLQDTTLVAVADRLVTADMRDFARSLPTHSVDLCFTDFPFGIDYEFGSRDRNKYEDSQESLRDLLADIVPEIIRVTKPTGWLALMMGSTNYDFLKQLVSSCCATHFDYVDGWWEQKDNGDWQWIHRSRCRMASAGGTTGDCRFLTPEDPEWIWFRPNSRQPSMWPELHAQNQYEKLCVVNMGQAVIIKKSLGNVLVHDAVYEDRIHEMQRPHGLCLDVVSRLTLGGERVLDLCYGSGSALAAAAELQRDFLGCDINPNNRGPALMWVAEHFDKVAVSNGDAT
jgi:ParB/RepB/Spo0J family partition protein